MWNRFEWAPLYLPPKTAERCHRWNQEFAEAEVVMKGQPVLKSTSLVFKCFDPSVRENDSVTAAELFGEPQAIQIVQRKTPSRKIEKDW